MSIVVVKSHRPMEYLRMGLLETCLRSVANAFPTSRRVLLMNDAGDGSAHEQMRLAADLDFEWVDPTSHALPEHGGRRPGYSPGHGARFLFDWAMEQARDSHALGGDLLVTSDDDMLWHAGAEERLEAIWAATRPYNLANLFIVGGLLEREWKHNTVRGGVELQGAETILLRDSVPGAAWSLPMRHVDEVRGLIPERFGYDSKVCEQLRMRGALMAAVDLCEHIGEDASTHENRPTRDLRGGPVDKKKWGLR